MKRLVTLTAALALVAGLSPALAQTTNFVPGEEFLTMWDIDGDGKVTPAEAREKRTDIFAMFDTDDNGSYSADELKGIDEHKQMELEAGMGPGHNMPEGMQPGFQQGQFQQGQFQQGQGMMGRGPGKGQGQGRGQAMRQNQMAQNQMPQNRMNGGQMGQQGFFASAQDEIGIFDANRDGTVTRDEFINGTDAWFAMRDGNGDGALTLEDFGPRR